MLSNYLKVAWRAIQRHKTDTVVNVVGLALGIGCCVLLGLYVRSEWTYDQFHEKADRIVRVNRVSHEPSGDRNVEASTPSPLAAALRESFPEVETTVRMNDGSVQVKHQENSFDANALYADSTFFEVFSFALRRGNPDEALRTPRGIVLTPSAAETYVGTVDAVGKSLTVQIEDESLELEVTGIVEAPPARSSIQFDVLLPFNLYRYTFSGILRKLAFQRWDFPVATTFALLHRSGQREQLESTLDAFAAAHFGEPPSDDQSDATVYTDESPVQLALQPLPAIHLDPSVPSVALTAPSDPIYSYLLAGAALLVLLIGGINFTTLALGRSAGRAKEVGVRKVLGAERRQVRGQYWGEALLTSGAALLLGLALAALFLPTFNQMVGTDLHFWLSPSFGLGLLGLAIAVGLVAGSYPALVLSRFEAASILRGSTQIKSQSTLVGGLVVLQFVLSMGLVAGTLIMSEQLDFMRGNLGFRSEHVIRVDYPGNSSAGAQIYGPFREEVTRHPAVKQVASSTLSFFGNEGMTAPLALGDTAEVTATVLPVDSTFRQVLDIALVGGRGFSARRATDENGVLVNEALVQAIGWTSPLGKTIRLSERSMLGKVLGTVRVIGVVENFHTRSMRHRVQPVMLASSEILGGGVGSMYVRIESDRTGEALASIENTWKRVVPGQPFQYQFLDEVVGEAYQAEQRQHAIVRAAGGFALLIACFGLFGLAALAVARRTREVGIRKALGASAESIVLLFTTNFLKLAGIAIAVAVPLTYWGAEQWLQHFTYRIHVGPGLFLMSGSLVAGVAFLTVTVQAWRAARIDPATTLRDE